MRKACLPGAVAILLSLTSMSPAQASPPGDKPPDGIIFDIASVNGSGCPLGSSAIMLSPDKTALTVTYSQYNSSGRWRLKSYGLQKNCQMNLQVHVPQGHTNAIASADYRGFAHLEPGASGVQKASYYFQGSPQTAQAEHNFRGPYDDSWQARDTTGVESLVWAPCGEKRNFNINTEIRVNRETSNPALTSFMAMDSTGQCQRCIQTGLEALSITPAGVDVNVHRVIGA